MHRPFRDHAAFCIGTFLTVSLVMAGCSTGLKIHKSAKGSVQLQEVADWSFEASHPAIIDQATMLKILKGVTAEEAANGSAKMPASGSKPMRTFSDEDAEFLAPLLAQALSQAKPEQIVGFTVSPSAGSGSEPTAGTLYVQGPAIYFTVTSGKKASAFMPASAARIEKAPAYASAGSPGAVSLAIDYQAVAKISGIASAPLAAAARVTVAPAPASQPAAKAAMKQEQLAPVRTAAPMSASVAESSSADMTNGELLAKKMDELRQARETNALKESEIKMLRKEVEWMKQELRERTDELKAMRASRVSSQPSTKKRTAEARPVR